MKKVVLCVFKIGLKLEEADAAAVLVVKPKTVKGRQYYQNWQNVFHKS